ncbi:MAG TPA: replication-associated recombination protein A [Desulfatirhabdiaceae bacterium]|nr:replication-associated recombination protein A [Desulfatirhabdiaceae bacterium]
MSKIPTMHLTGTAVPLAERMRPVKLAEFIGQSHVVGDGTILHHAIASDQIFSMILWGPPGVGKTTLARIVAQETKSHFVHFSAVLSGVKEIRAVIEDASSPQHIGHRTILFVDEIHRFNKSQQDAFLPHVESGLITLIGATTENPSFEVIPALLSRCQVLVLNRLTEADLSQLIARALTSFEKGLGYLNLNVSDDAIAALTRLADGDARTALNLLETIGMMAADGTPDGKPALITVQDIETALQKKLLLYDKSGEEHYNLISAFHKSLRGSDPDAALYWLERMLLAGEDPLYIARRMVRFASEDVGNADPLALEIALNAMESFRFLGYPEGNLALAQAVIYLATAPKSNSIYMAYGKVQKLVKDAGALSVPLHIRNAPTRLMKDMGYGRDYRYAHDYPDAWTPQDYLPEKIVGHRFYFPSDRGYEKTVKERLERWMALKKTRREQRTSTSRDQENT